MSEQSDKTPHDGSPPDPPSRDGLSVIHHRLYRRSAVNTLLFYGTALALCLLIPVIISTGVGLFCILFYKREIIAFLRSPLRRTRLRVPDSPEQGPYRLERLPPGTFDQTP